MANAASALEFRRHRLALVLAFLVAIDCERWSGVARVAAAQGCALCLRACGRNEAERTHPPVVKEQAAKEHASKEHA
jgi:hypothetical protein